MKVLILIILFIFTSSVFATEYIVYSSKPQSKLNQLGFKTRKLFTKNEQKMLLAEGISSDQIIVETTDVKSLKTILSQICEGCKIEENYIGKTQNTKDPYYEFQWALQNLGKPLENWTSDIDAYQTQGELGQDININESEKENNILVAIIDSGIDTEHPDLKNQIYSNEKECKALEEYNTCLNTNNDKDICYAKYANFDANGNGYPLDCHGWNITGKSNPKTDLEGNGNINDIVGHGTHVAGIIGAEKNEIGVTGVISHVKLLPIQVSIASQNSNAGELATDKFAKALLYAIQSKAQIVNMSLGWRFDQDSLLMRQMIELALSKEILIVAAGGNDNHAGPTYPCSYEEVICVGSHTVNGKLSSFSNYGAHIDISAPGTKILSTWPTAKRSQSFTIDQNYEYLSGTSQAAPYISGILARLLNQGLSPNKAKVKLFLGARKKIEEEKNYIRNGNTDYIRSINTEFKSFIYPLNKSPALINWDKETKTFKVNLKNYGLPIENTSLTLELITKPTQEAITLLNATESIAKLASNEVKEIIFKFNAATDIEGNFLFKLNIKNQDEEKSYFIQAKALALISPTSEREDLKSFLIEGNSEFLNTAIMRPFKDFSKDNHSDFLALKVIDSKTVIARVRKENESYQVSKELALPFANPVIINLSKVDLELDGSIDYVITLVNIISQEERETRFLALDSDFKPKKIEIAPKNSFDNKYTVLPGSFIWLKDNNRMVPAWISLGERPLEQRPAKTPWANEEIEFKRNHLYIQLPTKLKTIVFPESEEMPLHFLYQSENHTSEGKAIIISSIGLGYYKQYKVYEFNQSLKYIQDIQLNRFFDFASARPLPIVDSFDVDHAFFNTQSIQGSQNVLAIKYNSEKKKLHIEQTEVEPISERNGISFVLSYQDGETLSQTSTQIIYQGEHTESINSNTDAKRIKHELLKSKQALYLSSDYTPGIGAEVILKNTITHQLYRPAHLQTLGVSGCVESGVMNKDKIDYLLFICADSKKIIEIEI